MEETVSVAILLNNEHIPKDIFKSYVDDYFGPQLEDFKESSLSVCILSEKTGLIPSKNNVATFVKSQWLFLTSCKLNEIFEFKLVICENQTWNIIASEDMSDGRLIQTFETSSDNVIVVHIEWNKPHTVSVESILELHSMDESLLKSHYENQEASETFINLETITEDNNDDESLLDSLQEESDKNEAECKLDSSDTDISLEPEKNVYSKENTDDASVTNENYNGSLQNQMVHSVLNDSLEQMEKNNSEETEENNQIPLNENMENAEVKEHVDEENLENSLETSIDDKQKKKAVALNKIQSILGVKSELDRIKKASQINKTSDISLKNQQTDVDSIGSKVLQESESKDVDVASEIENENENEENNEDQLLEMDDDSVFNLESNLHENEHAISFGEESIPINFEKEEFANDSVYVNEKELHELNIADNFQNNNESIKLMNFQEMELPEDQILTNTEELTLHDSNIDITDESLENDSINKTYRVTEENQSPEIQMELEENLEIQDTTEMINDSQFEEEMCSSTSNTNNLDHDDLKDSNFNNDHILQPVPCIMVLSQHEVQEMETLESPVLANAVENLHEVNYEDIDSKLCTIDNTNSILPLICQNEQPNIIEDVDVNINENKIHEEKYADSANEEEDFNLNNEIEESQNIDLINQENTDMKEDKSSDFPIPELDLENSSELNINEIPFESSEIKSNLNDVSNINESDSEDKIDDSNITSDENMELSETNKDQSETHFAVDSSPTNNIDVKAEIKPEEHDANEALLSDAENTTDENQESLSTCLSDNFYNPHPDDSNISIEIEPSETNPIKNTEFNIEINVNNEEEPKETIQMRQKEKDVIPSHSTEEDIMTDTKTDTIEEDSQPRVSDIIEKFEVLQKQEESTNKGLIDNEKEKHRVSDIIKKFEDFKMESVEDTKNIENENKKRHSKISNKNIESKIQELYHEKESRPTSKSYQEYQNTKIIQNENDLTNLKENPKHVDNTSKMANDIDPENKTELGINDDYKYPDSVTPTKVEHSLSKLKEYDVLFMDDDIFNKDNLNKELRDSIMKPYISMNADSLTPVSEIPIKNTPKASIETLEESEIEKVKQSIEAQTPEPKRKGIMNLCGCMGGRKRS